MQIYEDLDPNMLSHLKKKISDYSYFWSLIGMELVDIKKGWAKISLPFDKKICNALDIAHGGTIFSTADSAIGMALLGLIDKDKTVTTLEMKINFIRPFSKGKIFAEARIVHKGNQTAIGEAEVKDNHGELIARGTATYMIVERKKLSKT